MKASYRKNRDRKLEYNKAYYATNRDELIAKQLERDTRDPQDLAIRRATGYFLDRERRVERQKDYWARMSADRKYAIKSKYSGKATTRYKALAKGAQQRGISFDITLDEYRTIVALGMCCYCQGALPHVAGHGIDRKDSSLGYTAANCVPCCGKCNHAKGAAWTHDEVMLIMERRRAAGWEGWTDGE